MIAVIPGYRGILYQRLFSSAEPDFRSVSAEIQQALTSAAITWLMDRGFDDIAVWRTMWSLGQHLVCRVAYQQWLVEYTTAQGWRSGHVGAALPYRRPLARVETTMEVRLSGQRTAMRQPVSVHLSPVPLRVSDAPADAQRGPRGGCSGSTLGRWWYKSRRVRGSRGCC